MSLALIFGEQGERKREKNLPANVPLQHIDTYAVNATEAKGKLLTMY